MYPKTMYVYVDESGGLRANQLFIAGAWFTWRPKFWLTTTSTLRSNLNFWREMHFHKVSRKNGDSQYEMIQALLNQLVVAQKTWYARFMYVNEEEQLARWRDYSCVDIYDFLMGHLFNRFGGHFPEKHCVIVLDEKNRPHWDNYIPVGLERYLNMHAGTRTNTTFKVETASSSHDDLLQVSDILTAAVRQLYIPSNNPNKRKLALTVSQVMDRIKIWDGH